MRDLAGLIADLGDVALVTDPARVQQKSRDFYWYSPVLKRQLEHVCADSRGRAAGRGRVGPPAARLPSPSRAGDRARRQLRARQDGLVKKLIAPVAAPILALYFRPAQGAVSRTGRAWFCS
jgi:hypothetical protein